MLLFSTLKLLNKQLTIGFDRDKFRAINSVTTTTVGVAHQDQNHYATAKVGQTDSQRDKVLNQGNSRYIHTYLALNTVE